MFKKILVPLDGSEGSWRALEHAIDLGAKFESQLVVVTVIQPYSNASLLSVPLDSKTVTDGNIELSKIGDKVLQMAAERLISYKNGVDYCVEIGHPSERIIALAKKDGVDTIVIGSRGLSGIAEFFLGSVSSKVSQYATVPVLIVK